MSLTHPRISLIQHLTQPAISIVVGQNKNECRTSRIRVFGERERSFTRAHEDVERGDEEGGVSRSIFRVLSLRRVVGGVFGLDGLAGRW